MNFSEIMEIDYAPFERDLLMKVCHPHQISGSITYLIYNILIFRYFAKFEENYSIGCKPDTTLLKLRLELLEEQEFDMDVYDTLAEREYENQELFNSFIAQTGWRLFFCDAEDMVEIIEGTGKDQHDEDISVEQIVQRISKNTTLNKVEDVAMFHAGKEIIESIFSLEAGELCFIWNKKLAVFMQLRKRYRKLVKKIIPQENKAINEVVNEIQSPLLYFWDWNVGLLTDRYYIAFCLGHNGYDNVCWNSINYNALIGFFVLDLLLQNAMEKLMPELQRLNLEV